MRDENKRAYIELFMQLTTSIYFNGPRREKIYNRYKVN